MEATDRGPVTFYLDLESERDGLRDNRTIHKQSYAKGNTMVNVMIQEISRLNRQLDVLGCYIASRHNILSKLSQYNSHPHEEHMNVAKHVLLYFNKYSKGKITYSSKSRNITDFSSADWSCNQCDRKSYTGCVFLWAVRQ